MRWRRFAIVTLVVGGLIAGVVEVGAQTVRDGHTVWRLPATIQTLRDVPVRRENGSGQQHGVIYADVAPFTIRKGTTFQMTKIYSEGECQIRLRRRLYDVSSCWWLAGFADPATDVFRVVAGRERIR